MIPKKYKRTILREVGPRQLFGDNRSLSQRIYTSIQSDPFFYRYFQGSESIATGSDENISEATEITNSAN